MKSLGEVHVRSAFALASAVHIGTSKDGEEVGIGGELVVGQLYGEDSLRLSLELVPRIGDDIDPIEKNFGGKTSRIEA